MGVGAGLYMYDVVVKMFTFAISSPDEFLFFYLFFLTSLLPYLPVSVRIGQLCLQATGRKKRPNLAYVVLVYFKLYHFCVPDAWLFFCSVALFSYSP